MQSKPVDFPGRGGSAFAYASSDASSHTFLLVGGASRNDQYDDFYSVKVNKQDDSVVVEKIKIGENDGFGARHSFGAVSFNNKTVMFGGQDVIQEKCLDDVFVFDHAQQKLEKIEYLKQGDVVPKERNSHSFVANGKTAYIFGGANNEGPLNDAFELDLESL